MHASRDAVGEFPAGAWFVDLASRTEPRLVPHAVATALELREDAGRSYRQALFAFLRDKKLLLILDNCEHLLRACGELADSLLKECPQLHILATSRQTFGITGEAVVRV